MKVSKRKVLKLAAALSLLLMMYLALNKFHNTRCDSIDIVIKDSLEAHFVESNEVLDFGAWGSSAISRKSLRARISSSIRRRR